MLVWLAIICVSISAFGIISLVFIRSYQIGNYHQFFMTLWGIHKESASRIAKTVVSFFFDVYQTGLSIISCAAHPIRTSG